MAWCAISLVVSITFAAWLMLAGLVVGGWFAVAFSVMGIIHSPVVVHFLPHTICLPRYVMLHPIIVNSTVQPASQRLVTDRSECDASPGMICPCRAGLGRCGMSRLHVCVDVTRSPFGICTTIGVVAGMMSMTGALVMRK